MTSAKSNNVNEWRELETVRSPAIRERLIRIGDSLWISTSDKKHFSLGESGLVQYCLKSNKIVDVVHYPANIRPIRHALCAKSQSPNIYIVDGERGMIISFDSQKKAFEIVVEQLTLKIGGFPSCVVIDDDLHIFHGKKNDGNHIIYCISSKQLKVVKQQQKQADKVQNSSQGKNEDEKQQDTGSIKDGVRTLMYNRRIIAFGGFNVSLRQKNADFEMSGVMKSGQETIEWTTKPSYKMQQPLTSCGYVLYKHFVLTFGGFGAKYVDTIYLLDLRENTGWIKLEQTCPMPSNYLAIVIDDVAHLFTECNVWPYWSTSIRKHYCISMKRVLGSWDDDDDDAIVVDEEANQAVSSNEEAMSSTFDDAKCNELGAELMRVKQMKEQLEEVVTELRKNENAVRSENQTLKFTCEQLHSQNADLKTSLQSAQTDNAKLNEDCKEAQMELNEMKRKLSTLQRMQHIDAGNYLNWDSDDIVDWLLTLDDGVYAKYEETLRQKLKENNVDGSELVHVDKQDLLTFGVSSFKHRRGIMEHFQALSQNQQQQHVIPSVQPMGNNHNDENHGIINSFGASAEGTAYVHK